MDAPAAPGNRKNTGFAGDYAPSPKTSERGRRLNPIGGRVGGREDFLSRPWLSGRRRVFRLVYYLSLPRLPWVRGPRLGAARE